MQVNLKVFLIGALVAVIAPQSALAVSPDETDPVAIMKAVETQPEGDKLSAKMTMRIKDQSGSQRVRVVRVKGMEFDGARKQLIIFESPADVEGTGLLTVDYDDGAKVDDQWLYLPALRKSTRIASSAKSGAFMGSDLSFADMTTQATDQYTYTMLDANAAVKGEACWKIEARPATAKAKEETGYLKSTVWVSKEKLVPLQAVNLIREGKKVKQMVFGGIKKHGNIWFTEKVSARTMQGKKTLSQTALTFTNITFGSNDVSDAEFTQRRLEQGL